ncbi:tetratricopeptide repeat protein [Desulfurobacterium atlanticum]|uniref:Tetratricopeptide repeat-containing protein n=1 Tax=Desulfurobacterium atlanticum TaxID=240169 RepID=A0A238XUM5_9BACT|nr:tetratricopeptide repeat protein [Desulfurobacterium atlanticum]SNR62221.1 Tetratricopeptide repeat-containing protein [Desulfurobacterium atlanticum]
MVSRIDPKLEIVQLILEEKYNEALKKLLKVLKREPNNYQIKMLLFDIYYNMGNKNRAIDIATEVSEQLLKEGFYDTVIGYLKKVTFYVKHPKIYRILFRALVKRGLDYEAFKSLIDFVKFSVEKGEFTKEAFEFIEIVKDLCPIPALVKDAENLKRELHKKSSQ